MKKSKRNFKLKKRLTRKYGGKKNNTALLVTQMGGAPAPYPKPAPAPGVSYSLNYATILPALKTFADGIATLVNDTQSDIAYANKHYIVAQGDLSGAKLLQTAANSLMTAYLGYNPVTGLNSTTEGLYNKVLNNGPRYVIPAELLPQSPAPAPG